MEPFFKAGEFACPFYQGTRDKTDEFNTRGREFIESLWQECSTFLDPDTLQRATLDMPSVFWELYVAYSLKRNGVSLRPQDRTKQNKKGPDIFAATPDVWIEAVMPRSGTGPDAMEHPPVGKVYETPVNSFVLRLTSAFKVKADRFANYAEEGLIHPGQATVIAICGGLLPTAIGEGPVPRSLKALLGVGNPVFELDRGNKQIVDRYVEQRDTVQKKSGLIRTDPFLDPAYSHISAVLYSPCDWVNHPSTPGVDFTCIHNQNANVKLPRGWLSVGDEYWRDQDKLHSAKHPQSDVASA